MRACAVMSSYSAASCAALTNGAPRGRSIFRKARELKPTIG
jgi:hypothetical protein